MIVAVDTNVVVRLLVADDPDQAGRARELFDAHEILLLPSVLLECEWVLRSAYKFTAEQIGSAFISLCGLEQVTLGQADIMKRTLDGFETGLDFADALHLASSSPADRFATFDRDLIKRASETDAIIVAFEP